MKAFWDLWGPWISGGGFVMFLTLLLSYIARPSAQTIADLRADLDAQEARHTRDMGNLEAKHSQENAMVRGEISAARTEIGSLRESNFHMRVVFTTLAVQYNVVREELLKRDPGIRILTIQEIVDESHVPLQSVTMFDPSQIGFLWPNGHPPTPAPSGTPAPPAAPPSSP